MPGSRLGGQVIDLLADRVRACPEGDVLSDGAMAGTPEPMRPSSLAPVWVSVAGATGDVADRHGVLVDFVQDPVPAHPQPPEVR